MQIQFQPKPQFLLNTFLLFFIIHDIQVGIGIHGFQRVVYLEAKHDAWISVILAGIITHLVVFVIIKTLQIYGSSDIYGIQFDIFGKWIGKLFNCVYILYCLWVSFVVIKNYIEVLQTWVFPTVPTWLLASSLLLLVIYGVTGGIRVIVGVSFFNILLSIWLAGFIGFPFRYGDFHHLLPIMESSIPSILSGSYKMGLALVGFEILYAIYPFLKEKEKVQKFAHLGIAATTILYLIIMLISTIYFSPGQLNNTVWATLSLVKIVKLPFIERMEYVAVSFWLLIILPNLMLYIWAAVLGIKRTFKSNSKWIIWFFSILLFIASLFFNTRPEINSLNDFFSSTAFYFVFCYPFILYGLALLRKKIKSYKEKR